MNAKKTSLVLSLVTCGAFALVVGCAGDGGGDTPGTNTNSNTNTNTGNTTTTTTTSTGTPSGDDVTFKTGQAQGAMKGYGWVAMGSQDSVTSPTCDSGVAISSTTACTTSTVWSKDDALCISGSIPALPAAPVQSDYDNNWGVQIGVNSNEPNDAIGKSFSTVAVAVSGSPTAGLRVMLHRKGDPDGTAYCATWAGSPLPLSAFNTKCWDNSGDTFTADDAPKTDKVMIQVPSSSSAITVTELCLSKITLK